PEIPEPIVEALGPLMQRLAALGYQPTSGRFDPDLFGNFLVGFENGTQRFELVRDRSQFMVEGEPSELEPFGLFQAFNSVAELEAPLLTWLEAARHSDA